MNSIKRLLIVKTSSMGDVIHMLPAISDMARVFPQITIDWAVEEGFAAIPSWHPAVNQVIPVAIRRWRKNLFSSITWQQVRQLRKQLRDANYDLVIDSQGLFKSAMVASWAKRPVAGMDRQSAREAIAARFYRDQYPVARGQHAVPRNRQLTAQALGYSLQDMPLDYGVYDHLVNSELLGQSLEQLTTETPLPERFVIFLHAASTPEKEWPVDQWNALGQVLNEKGLSILLPWGDERERANAQVIARGLKQAQVLPRLGLNELAALFLKTEFLVGEDSGLSHMAAALDKPIIALYLVTDPALTGVMGSEVGKDCKVKNLQLSANDGPEKILATIRDWFPALA
jgi:heptosyltransferase I